MHRGSGLGRLCATVLLQPCMKSLHYYMVPFLFGSATSFFLSTPCGLIPFYSSILSSVVIHYVWQFPWLLAFSVLFIL
ncbi:hypothetical protein BDV27DRAFT_111534 [Aspergillus caelatus]|uniref:Uncharacterized protein n=1 Tax=Aspergillus caelatus TaxID=61420 RepID=A0A5N7A566_9EURO|nr:uncharacterized protein BDV27DRAFT_111534 [Aspergillus caelatus]KAE8364733.1 hypothetical protein BDV27DRAFT_111534 [Aspergillus caelatus]